MLSHYVNIYLALKFVSFCKIMALIEVPLEILDRPTIGKVFLEMFLYLGPVWIAFLVGVLVGWAWKPRWVISKFNGKFNICSPPATISSSVGVARDGSDNDQIDNPFSEDSAIGSSQLESDKSLAVSDEDLKHLYDLVERKDGGTPWKHMMENSTHNMSYQAWQRVPETGPPQYRSRTVYEDATPELLRDFFWDDEFRSKWNNMIIHADIIEECPTTGTMVVHWVRKFPFFCSDREYIIGRRIWESGRSYYCVTKGVSNDSIPRQDKPRRVDLYYSSWFIRAVESRNGNGQLSACELILFHYEDMGIPWEIAKYGVRQGMWGAVKKVERGFRLYQKERSSVGPVSRCAFLASINTKVNPGFLESLENDEDTAESETDGSVDKPGGLNIHQALVFGGAVALAFSLNRGLLTKALILGVAIRFGNIGRR